MELSEEESIYNLLKFAKNKDGSGIRNNQRWKPKINPDCIVLPKYLDKKTNDDIKSNLSYNFKYLEYLQMQCDEFILTPVLNAMIRKNYIITGVSIIELCFAYYLQTLDFVKHTENFSSIIDKTNNEKGRSYFNLTETDFENLKNLKTLRNYVHIAKKNTIESEDKRYDMDKDYNAFNCEGKNEETLSKIKGILYKLFGKKDSKFAKNIEDFQFLNPTIQN